MTERGIWDCHHCKYHLFQEGNRENIRFASCENDKLSRPDHLKFWDGCGDKDSEPCVGFEDS